MQELGTKFGKLNQSGVIRNVMRSRDLSKNITYLVCTKKSKKGGNDKYRFLDRNGNVITDVEKTGSVKEIYIQTLFADGRPDEHTAKMESLDYLLLILK